MRWTIEHKPCKPRHKFGDKKIKKHFCLFPKSDYNNGTTTYFWLETIYIVYEWTEGGYDYSPWGTRDIEPDYWNRLGIATSYNNAVKEIWGLKEN
jgi:hypothetical protein